MKVSIIGSELLAKEIRSLVKKNIKTIACSSADNKSFTVCFIDESQMIDLQKQFKNKDKVTDVLSFPIPEMERSFSHTKHLLGDIVICVEQAKYQATKLGHDLVDEISILTVHGLCHLLGFDHEEGPDEALAQMQAEIEILQKSGLDYSISLISRNL